MNLCRCEPFLQTVQDMSFDESKQVMITLGNLISLYAKTNPPASPLSRDANRKSVLGKMDSIHECALEWIQASKVCTNVKGWPQYLSLLLSLYGLSKVASPLLLAIVENCKEQNDALFAVVTACEKRKRTDSETESEENGAKEPIASSPKAIERRDISNERKWTKRMKVCTEDNLHNYIAGAMEEVDNILMNKTRTDALLVRAIGAIPIEKEVEVRDDSFDDLCR